MREEWKKEIRKSYTRIVEEGVHPRTASTYREIGKQIGYTEEELQFVPEGSNLGLGCGNPVALASLRSGETVIDLGSGAGLDCFLAAKKVGKNGKVIGIDMTSAMINKARENARKGNYENVEFSLGVIENLPVADNTADVAISNCVINFSPDRRKVFKEAFRVLRPGGRLMISDIALLKKLPESIRKQTHPASCIHGAIMKDEYISTIEQAGFQNVKIVEEKRCTLKDIVEDPLTTGETLDSTVNITFYAMKPKN